MYDHQVYISMIPIIIFGSSTTQTDVTHDLQIMTVHFMALRTMQQKNLAHYVSLMNLT